MPCSNNLMPSFRYYQGLDVPKGQATGGMSRSNLLWQWDLYEDKQPPSEEAVAWTAVDETLYQRSLDRSISCLLQTSIYARAVAANDESLTRQRMLSYPSNRLEAVLCEVFERLPAQVFKRVSTTVDRIKAERGLLLDDTEQGHEDGEDADSLSDSSSSRANDEPIDALDTLDADCEKRLRRKMKRLICLLLRITFPQQSPTCISHFGATVLRSR